MDVDAERELVVCARCKSDHFKVRHTVDGFKVVKCLNCSLIYTQNPIAQGAITKLYTEGYFIFKEGASKVRGFDDLAIVRDRLGLLTNFKKGGRLLEIGCGTGNFLHLAQRHFDSHGIDISEDAARYGRETLKLDIQQGVVEDERFPNGSFDAVVMWHVLEHVVNPNDTVKRIGLLLKRDGIFGLEVPNYGYMLHRFNGKRWEGGGHPRNHRFHFTVKTLKAILEHEGMEPLFLSTKWIHRGGPFSPMGPVRGMMDMMKMGPVIRIFARNRDRV